jgi:signal peptidase I
LKTRTLLLLILTFAITLTGCFSSTITDTVTDKKIKIIENPDASLTKVRVQTDGMLSEVGYNSGHHPFGLGDEVLVDAKYYAKNKISRGDIVLFKTNNNSQQNTDVARVVGLPGEMVDIKIGQVYINGKKLDTFYGDDSSFNNNDSMKQPLKLKENAYFILADVRWRGFNDSQTGNAFSKEEILGKVVGYEKRTSVEKIPFSVSISAPSQIKSNEEFTVEATLKNLTDDDFKIRHAAGAFYFTIKDSNGRGINTFGMHDVGIIRTIQGKGVVTEQYKYKLNQPGDNEVSAAAKFSVDKGEKIKDYEIKTDSTSINIAE